MAYITSGFAVWSIIRLILVLILVIMLAYVATKYVAKYQKNILSSKSNIQICDSFRIGGNKFIAIVKIGGNYYALGVSKDDITMIDKIDEDKLSFEQDDSFGLKKLDFKEVFDSVKNKKKKDDNDQE